MMAPCDSPVCTDQRVTELGWPGGATVAAAKRVWLSGEYIVQTPGDGIECFSIQVLVSSTRTSVSLPLASQAPSGLKTTECWFRAAWGWHWIFLTVFPSAASQTQSNPSAPVGARH